MGTYFNKNWAEKQYISSIFDQLNMSSAFSRQNFLGLEGLIYTIKWILEYLKHKFISSHFIVDFLFKMQCLRAWDST